ncbi:glycoside hydrolase family 26 protein [Flavitalea flava]
MRRNLIARPLRLLIFSVFLIGLSSGITSGQDLPVDRNASPETVNLYHNLKKLTNKGFLFGHQDDLAYGVNWKYIPGRSDIRDVTGEYPGLYGWELGRIELDHLVNIDSVPFDKMKQFIRDGYERGSVITISWHLNNPLTGGTAWQPAPGTVAAILPGGEKNALYTSWLDKVAAFLLDLKGRQGEPIPVILRLFHEINGNWFWWGGKNSSAEEMKTLWQFTVRYLRDEKKIHSILYAYNTDRFTSESAYFDKYPGDEWVDITGFDIYQGNKTGNTAFIKEFDHTLSQLEKIAADRKKIPALTEFGYNSLPDNTWWTNVFGKTLGDHRLAYVMAWRNAGPKSDGSAEFYVPYKGQGSAEDFRKLTKGKNCLLEQDTRKLMLYRKN